MKFPPLYLRDRANYERGLKMIINPPPKYRKARDAGYKARKEKIPIEKNPNRFGPDIVMSGWWEAGWMQADRNDKNHTN